jgi:hypothetical protein
MTLLLIGALAALTGYLRIRLSAANNENTALRAQVASLKRQLGRLR